MWHVLRFAMGICGCVQVHAGVPSMIQQVAQEQGVPPDIFYSILLAESRSQTSLGVKPWPWTLNHQGQAHYFPDRISAFTYAESLVNQGDLSFDVGIAQMNWRWHQHRFDFDVWTALDPYRNLTAAAAHFKEQSERQDCQHWALAIGCYHRPARGERDIEIANRYAQRVIEIWEEHFYFAR